MNRFSFLSWLVAASLTFSLLEDPGFSKLSLISLPEGFSIEYYAENVFDARSLALSDNSTVFVGSRKAGRVYALIDNDKDMKADEVITVASGLNMPNGVAFKGKDLYVAEADRIIKFPDIENNLFNHPVPIVVNENFPRQEHHSWKYIKFGPDGLLYVPIGAPCNVCDPSDERFMSIMRLNPDGSGLEIFAEGVRNTVGFDWHPETGVLYFTDNGRDWMGEDVPPDELNRASRKGLHFGFPYCHGRSIPDPEYGSSEYPCSKFSQPVAQIAAHSAALGMIFYTGDMFPEEYRNQILIAEHGSWNRSLPAGYQISKVDLKNESAVVYEVFATGWIEGLKPWGRPVDLLEMPDGSVLVSDDHRGQVYRISYEEVR